MKASLGSRIAEGVRGRATVAVHTKRSSPSPSAGTPSGHPGVPACGRDAARVPGIAGPVAAHFCETGVIEIAGEPLVLQPLHDDPAGPWIDDESPVALRFPGRHFAPAPAASQALPYLLGVDNRPLYPKPSGNSMTATASAPAGTPAGHPRVKACRREAALALGIDAPAAAQFGETGVIDVAGQPLVLQPLHEEPAGPWIASTRAARPEGMSEEAWCDALLLANNHSQLLAHAAFGLAPDGDAVLVLRIPPAHDDPSFLALQLSGLLLLVDSLCDGVRNAAATNAPHSRTLQ